MRCHRSDSGSSPALVLSIHFLHLSVCTGLKHEDRQSRTTRNSRKLCIFIETCLAGSSKKRSIVLVVSVSRHAPFSRHSRERSRCGKPQLSMGLRIDSVSRHPHQPYWNSACKNDWHAQDWRSARRKSQAGIATRRHHIDFLSFFERHAPPE